MAIRPVLSYPDQHLRVVSTPVETVNQGIKTLVEDMFETMYYDHGIGLAAIQINVPKRVIVIDLSEDKSEQLCLINPEITHKDGHAVLEQGCLSVPGVYVPVERAEHIKLRALDAEGKPFELETGGLLAHCIQHEIDHLEGKLIIDYLSPLKRERALKKLKKIRLRTL